ncbi:MAG: class I SAM-dependent rRNA methyltransferase [Chloroflexota bacterium]
MINLIQSPSSSIVDLQLSKELTRTIKRGNPWIFADALRHCPPAPPGTPARLLDKRKREIARGYYDSNSTLAFRVCTIHKKEKPNNSWAKKQLRQAIHRRKFIDETQTTGYRLINGEGDGLPGLVCDIYADTAVIKLDGPAASNFWSAPAIAQWLKDELGLQRIYERERSRQQPRGQSLIGAAPVKPISFLENGLTFTADIVRGQKTGFFLDQRENRQRIRQVAAEKRVLNMFGYTGGFSIYAGAGGATQVTTVDVAQPALDTATDHWHLNQLPVNQHDTVAQDAFEFLAEAHTQTTWDLVILDPPSFAPAKKAVPKAIRAYEALIQAGATVTASQGMLAAASCSSHITLAMFLEICESAISQARRRATIIDIAGQPMDHPSPLVLPEFRYLKFVLMMLD